VEKAKPITLVLSSDELNIILSALGGRPFGQVFRLINEIQEQVSKQFNKDSDVPLPKQEG